MKFLYISAMKTILKETVIIISFIFIAILLKGACTNIYKRSHAIPVISEENQNLFNTEVAYPSRESGNFAFGLKGSEYLDYPNYEFDDDITTMSQLENINEARSQILDDHAKEYERKAGTWCLLVLLGWRYGKYFFQWLKSKDF